jgi:hypothetical protein
LIANYGQFFVVVFYHIIIFESSFWSTFRWTGGFGARKMGEMRDDDDVVGLTGGLIFILAHFDVRG